MTLIAIVLGLVWLGIGFISVPLASYFTRSEIRLSDLIIAGFLAVGGPITALIVSLVAVMLIVESHDDPVIFKRKNDNGTN